MSVIYVCSVCGQKRTGEKAAEIGADACCMICAEEHNHPGKFQAYGAVEPDIFRQHYAEQMGKCLLLYEWMSEGDDHMSNEGWGYCARIDNYLVYEDTQGFVTFDEFGSSERAEEEFYKLYKLGWGASESDYYITWDRGKYRAYDGDSGKAIELWPDIHGEIGRRRALAAVSLHMRRTGYWPDVWEEGERGNITNVSEEVW